MTTENQPAIEPVTDEIESSPIDLGDGHAMTFSYYDGEPAGIRYTHPPANGVGNCRVGWIPFTGGRWAREFENINTWDVVQLDPLTLSPSLLCRVCGDHGFIRNSRWVRA